MTMVRSSRRSRPGVELLDDQGKDGPRGMLAEEDIQMAVAGQHVQGVFARRHAFEVLEGAHLALREEATVVLSGQEDKAGVGLGWCCGVVGRQTGQ